MCWIVNEIKLIYEHECDGVIAACFPLEEKYLSVQLSASPPPPPPATQEECSDDWK